MSSFVPILLRKYSQVVNEELILKHLDGQHAGITLFGLNRPEQKNAMSRTLLDSITKGLNQAVYDNKTRVLIMHSLVPGTFCAGTDAIAIGKLAQVNFFCRCRFEGEIWND